MPKIQDVLEPGEVLLKESSSGPFTQVTYVKSMMSNVQGRLFLTNQRLLFLPGNFQNTDSTMLVLGRLIKSPDSVHIPLSGITKVEKGWGEQIAVHAGQKYDFRGMSKAGDWVAEIDRARASPAPRAAPQPAYQAPPPPPVQYQQPSPAAGGAHCPSCGLALRPVDKFCPNCGAGRPSQQAGCPRCGNPVAPGQRFCNSCGAPLA